MGNCCGRESDPFSQPGRRLDSAPPTPASASVPSSATASQQQKKPPTVGGSPRTLGGGSGPAQATSGDVDASEARKKAADAAMKRNSKQGGGKLKAQLDKQRGMTDAQALQDASETERGYRTMDQSTGALAHS